MIILNLQLIILRQEILENLLIIILSWIKGMDLEILHLLVFQLDMELKLKTLVRVETLFLIQATV
ncbi:Uncharacterised protein [Mycobacterium tuberculosis]|nr:Uncharacterised protein [Mycobacterium tuberculosis]